MKPKQRALRKLWQRFESTDGSSTIEFVLWFPFFMMLFFTSFELSYYGLRSVSLERALDLNVREMRLGISRPDNLDEFKQNVCDEVMLFRNCMDEISIDLRIIDDAGWALPGGVIPCVDRAEDIKPLTTYAPGGSGDLVLVRVCVVKDPFFGTTPWVMGLPRDPSGGIAIAAVSTYVNEP